MPSTASRQPLAVGPLPAAERWTLLGGVGAVSAAAWIWMAHMSLAMADMMAGGASRAWMPPPAGPWSGYDFWMLFLMWSVMMVAMMTPASLPMLRMFRTMQRNRARQGQAFSSWAFLLAGYLAAWVLFSGAATFGQKHLHDWLLLTPMMESRSHWFSGALIAAAGLYQWTPWKDACLSQCRSPMQFLMARWRDGAAGAASMGLQHGLYCIGCCWLLMLMLVGLGMMNILWVAALTLFVLLERTLPPPARAFRTATGIAFLAAGLLVLAGVLQVAA